jgi:hypothetical protein
MNADPAKAFRTSRSLKLLRNWTSGESSDPCAAEAMKHLPSVAAVAVIVVVVVTELVDVVVVKYVEVALVVVVVVVLDGNIESSVTVLVVEKVQV